MSTDKPPTPDAQFAEPPRPRSFTRLFSASPAQAVVTDDDLAVRTGGGERLRPGGFGDDKRIDACEGIEEVAQVEPAPEPEPEPAPVPEPQEAVRVELREIDEGACPHRRRLVAVSVLVVAAADIVRERGPIPASGSAHSRAGRPCTVCPNRPADDGWTPVAGDRADGSRRPRGR